MLAAPLFSRHVLTRTVVLPSLRVLFLPVPKAGCTSMLWLLAELAGLPEERFTRSAVPEVSSSLTVHDLRLWPREHRLSEYEGAERAALLGADDGWLRFALVRDPAARLWSAWQSKLLLREPRFVEAFRAAPWFPAVPDDPAGLVEDFRRFVAALPGGEAEDVHWAVQAELVEQLPLTHVGRVERREETLALLRERVPAGAWPAARRRDNQGAIPLPPHAYDAASAAIVAERYAADYGAFGYAPVAPGGGDVDGWEAAVAPLLPGLRERIANNARVEQLHVVAKRRARRVQAAEERLEAVSARQIGHARSPVLTNVEGHTDFNVRWGWSEGEVAPGFTGVLRVRDEARSLPWVLPPLLRAVDRVVLVDNGSTDGTVEVAQGVAEACGCGDRLAVERYPFAIARCGAEHLGTPAGSVHSLAYFYNWAFAHVRTGYALKWDGDMVLSEAAVAALRDLAWQLEASEVVVRVPRHPLYLAGDGRAFVDTGLRNCEPWAWPNRPGWSFVKAMEWELPLWGSGEAQPATLTLPDWSCVELKHLDADEFAHWSATDFEASSRTRRKRREWEVFHALSAGAPAPEGVVEVVAPPGVHVVDHVRETWLPARWADAQGTMLST